MTTHKLTSSEAIRLLADAVSMKEYGERRPFCSNTTIVTSGDGSAVVELIELEFYSQFPRLNPMANYVSRPLGAVGE